MNSKRWQAIAKIMHQPFFGQHPAKCYWCGCPSQRVTAAGRGWCRVCYDNAYL